jgi:hypothetical protein
MARSFNPMAAERRLLPQYFGQRRGNWKEPGSEWTVLYLWTVPSWSFTARSFPPQ